MLGPLLAWGSRGRSARPLDLWTLDPGDSGSLWNDWTSELITYIKFPNPHHLQNTTYSAGKRNKIKDFLIMCSLETWYIRCITFYSQLLSPLVSPWVDSMWTETQVSSETTRLAWCENDEISVEDWQESLLIAQTQYKITLNPFDTSIVDFCINTCTFLWKTVTYIISLSNKPIGQGVCTDVKNFKDKKKDLDINNVMYNVIQNITESFHMWLRSIIPDLIIL